MPHMIQDMEGIARLGRFEDDTLAHVATGEMIVPPVITPATRQMVQQDMQNVGLNPNEYMVGGDMSINPNTGLPEFGFLSKVFKKIKKVVKKVAPIAVNFIPGVGPLAKAALTAGVGKASGMSTKDALLGGALSFAGSKFFGGTPTGTGTGTAASTGRFSRIKNFFNPAKGATGIRGGTLGPNIRRGIGSLFSGGQQPMMSGQQPAFDMVSSQLDPNTGMYVDGFGNTVDSGTYYQYLTNPSSIPMTGGVASQTGIMQGSVSDYDPVTGKGQSKIGKIEDFFKSMRGGQEGQSGIGRIEDFLKGRSSDDVRGGGMGNLGIAGLAGLIGKLAYDEAKDFKGVPLTPLTTTDQLGRYNIAAEIARQKGEEMPSRVEYGLNPQGMPVLQGGGTGVTPRSAAMGGMIYSQADGDHNGIMGFARGGVVEMQEGGEPPIDPANFPPMDGDINGPGTGTSDDIPAMLSDGEFVMTAKAVKGAGTFDMATNDSNGIVTLTPNGDPSRDTGTRVMYKLMEHFGSMA